MLFGLEIKFLDPVSLGDGDPGFRSACAWTLLYLRARRPGGIDRRRAIEMAGGTSQPA
jgi:hypothetical protein